MRILLTVLVALAVGAWARGAFDYALAPLGMNAGKCATVSSTTYCGPDLQRYRKAGR